MPKSKKLAEVDETKTIQQLLEQVIAGQKELKDALLKPITSQAVSIRELPTQLPTNASSTTNIPELQMIPADYRQTVDSILNKDFGIELEAHKDAPLLTLTIVVPEKYSQMTPTQKEILHRDIRPKVITTAGGVAEVREWAETVFKNLGPDLQAMVTSDRIKGV